MNRIKTNSERNRQGRWIGQQVETDDGDSQPDRPEIGIQGGPAEALGAQEPSDWNKGQMAITHGEPQPQIDPDSMGDSEAGPTGRRANPGGGQRWAGSDERRDSAPEGPDSG